MMGAHLVSRRAGAVELCPRRVVRIPGLRRGPGRDRASCHPRRHLRQIPGLVARRNQDRVHVPRAGASGTDPDYNIYVMNADGTGITRLTGNPSYDGFRLGHRTVTRSPSRPPATIAPTPIVPTAAPPATLAVLHPLPHERRRLDQHRHRHLRAIRRLVPGRPVPGVRPRPEHHPPRRIRPTSMQPGVAEAEFPDWAT